MRLIKANIVILVFFQLLTASCELKKDRKLFTLLTPSQSGVKFSNELIETDSANYFLYKSFYMGGGVAIGDVNNDGLQDIYLTGNMVENKLYLNNGDLKFTDITDQAGVGGDNRWMTGVTMADINNDGWLDIYVCAAGPWPWATRRNLLYINDGKPGDKPTFTESAEIYGIADAGNSTQAVFFDYDLDNDLDLYVINYPIVDTKTGIMNYRELMRFVHQGVSNHLYEYEDGKFKDVTVKAGVMRFGLSLGVSVADFNDDGWPDFYVSNDFATPDYFFFNNGDGTFTNKIEEATKHTSFYGMGVDAADVTNNGLLDILQVDMSPEDNFRSKSNMASMDTDVFWAMVNNGMYYQYMINSLQINMGLNDNGVPQFGEISQLANVSLTDWSWAPLIADFDNDGWKDLFVTNGTRREINNKDFFTEMNKDKQMASRYVDWVNKMPEAKVENYALKNFGGLRFEKVAGDWGLNLNGWSNGAAYADLDNDGDLDLVVNNIDDYTAVYENNAVRKEKSNYLRLEMKGPSGNKFGLGVKVTLIQGSQKQFQELTLTRGFQSSVEPVLHFGVGDQHLVEMVIVQWPDKKQQVLEHVKANQKLVIDYKNASANPHAVATTPTQKVFKDITGELGLSYRHTENSFDDFSYQLLMPHKLSQYGPALAVGDVNNDGLDDFFVGGATNQPGKIYIQRETGKFDSLVVDQFIEDKIHEDVDAIFFDANNDGFKDLYVVSGGNEAKAGDRFYKDRLYLNLGKGQFEKTDNALPDFFESGSVVRVADYDNDGDLDLFVGSRFLPRNYPKPGKSFLLRNESTRDKVKFTDVTNKIAKELSTIGMVTDAVFTDINNDEQIDLVLTGEWMPVTIFMNQSGHFVDSTDSWGIGNQTGWWSSIMARDFDSDGDIDLIAGNLGENYKYKATEEEPFSLYINDYDKNDKMDIVLAYMQEGEEYPLRGKQCSSQQIPAISIKFKDYNSFAKATLADVYSTQSLKESTRYRAVNFSTSYFENTGDNFLIRRLEDMAQISSVNAIYVHDIDGDGNQDIVLAGNLYGSEVETPRNDASYGLFMTGNGKGGFKAQMPYESGLMIRGEVRKMEKIMLKNRRKAILVARNNEELLIVEVL